MKKVLASDLTFKFLLVVKRVRLINPLDVLRFFAIFLRLISRFGSKSNCMILALFFYFTLFSGTRISREKTEALGVEKYLKLVCSNRTSFNGLYAQCGGLTGIAKGIYSTYWLAVATRRTFLIQVSLLAT